MIHWAIHQATDLVFELPRVSSSSSDTHSSWILSPSHGFTNPTAVGVWLLLLPNANSSEPTSDIWTLPWLWPSGTGEHVPLCPGVHILEPLASLYKPKGFGDTRLKVGDEGPPDGSRKPASHAASGVTWWPGLGGMEEGKKLWLEPAQGGWKFGSSQTVLIRGERAVGELSGGVTGALIDPPWM